MRARLTEFCAVDCLGCIKTSPLNESERERERERERRERERVEKLRQSNRRAG